MTRFLAALLTPLLLVSSAVAVESQTPAHHAAFLYQPFGQDSGLQNMLIEAIGALNGSGYTITSYSQSSASITPSVTLERDFVNALTGEYGVRVIVTHGSSDGLAVEVYPATQAGADSAVSQRNSYIRQSLFSASEIYVTQADNGTGWSINATPSLVRRLSRSTTNGLAFVVACQSGGYLGNFQGRWAAGVSGTSCTTEGIDLFWQRLASQSGANYRYASAAISGITGYGTVGDGATVLSPMLVGRSHAEGAVIDGRTSLWVEFDAVMDTLNKPAFGSEVFAVIRRSRHWSSRSRFEFAITGVQVGSGFVRIPAEAAISSPGGIKLVGGQDELLNLYSVRADNGAASVHGVRVAGGQLLFENDGEWNTGSYRIETAASPDGPFTTVATLVADGRTSYAVLVPPSPLYRVIEEETGGREFVVGVCGPDPRPNRPPDQMVDATIARQEIAQVLSWLQPENIGPPRTRFVIFTPQRWEADLQPIIDFWRPKGYAGEFVLTDAFPSDPDGFLIAAKAVVQAYTNQGVRYFWIVGTSNDYRQFHDEYQAWYTTPEWLQIRQTQLNRGYVRQPERDVFPTFYLPDPAPRGQNIGYQRPFLDSDAPLADTDDDGVPNVVLARLPVATDAEVPAAVWLIIQHAILGPAGQQVGILGNDWDAFGNAGALVRQDCETLSETIPVDVPQVVRFARTVPGGSYISGRTAAFNDVVNGGVRDLFIESTLSNRYRPGDWVDLEEGFRFSDNATGHRYFLTGASCEIAGSNRSLDPAIGLPWVESGLTTIGGPCAVAGFNTGSLQGGDGLLATEIARQLYAPPDLPLAEECLHALWVFMDEHPEYAELARTFSFQGFVLTTQTADPIPTDAAAVFRMALHPAWPNPCNPSTTIRYSLAATGPAQLTIYGVDGRLVRRLVDGVQATGNYHVVWNGRDDIGRPVASGVYVARFVTGGQGGLTRKVTLVR